MKLFPGATRFQRWTMGATLLIVATYAISQNKQSLVEVSNTRLSSPSPGIIDGDTIYFPKGRVSVVGIDAPELWTSVVLGTSGARRTGPGGPRLEKKKKK